jgi:hypothetical protein
MTITPDAIAQAFQTTPTWALLALTAPVERLREDGCREVANHVYSALYQPLRTDRDQLTLPLL